MRQLMKCCVEEITPDGRLIPFYNSVGYREHVQEQMSGVEVADVVPNATPLQPILIPPRYGSRHCPWKGKASYYTVEVGGVVNRDAAWTYLNPSLLARKIKGGVAFWHGIEARVDHPLCNAAHRPALGAATRWSHHDQ